MSRKQRRALAQIATAPPTGPEPTLVEKMFAEAVERHRAGQAAPAEALYRAILALQPEQAQVAYNLGIVLHAQRRFAEAVAAYRHAATARPDYAEAFCNLGVALQDERKLDEAIAVYGHAITLRPDFPMAHCNLGVALKEAGRLEDAVASYHRAIALSPTTILRLPISRPFCSTRASRRRPSSPAGARWRSGRRWRWGISISPPG